MASTVTPAIRDDKTVELSDEIMAHLGVRPGDRVEIEVVRPGAIEIRRALTPLPLDELLRRYSIDEPVDWQRLREEIEEDMARDALRGIDG